MDPALDGDITGGLSNKTIIAISISGFIILFTTLTFLYTFSSRHPDDKQRDRARRHQDANNNDAADYERALEDADVSTLNRAQRRARAKHRMKKNRRLASNQQPQPANPQPNQDDDGDGQQQQLPLAQIVAPPPPVALADGDDDFSTGGIVVERLSRKERQRAAKAEERRERLMYVEERKRQILILEQKRGEHRNDIGDDDKEDERDREERRFHLEMLKKEALEREYREWNLMFPSMHEKQNANDDDTDMDNDGGDNPQRETVQQFLTKLYAVRRISLAETARQRSISIPVLRKRLTQLEEEGRINHCGVVDEVRGEYTIVMSEDMEKLKQYIEEVGSVTLEEVRSNLMGILDLACGVRKDSPVVSGNSSGVLDLIE